MNTYSIALDLTPGCSQERVLALAVLSLRDSLDRPINELTVDFVRDTIKLEVYADRDEIFAAATELTGIPAVRSTSIS